MSELSALAVDTLIANRYRLSRTIGGGGMATVFEAVDTATQRPVALKLLNPSFAGSIGADRFLREISLTSQLRHPSIVRILDSGTYEGMPFLVMPLIKGDSLRDVLRREKQLPVCDAIRYARDILSALRTAHAVHIIHRDIKPANILIDAESQRAIIADFGIARAHREAASLRLTDSGIAVGTPGYMSPEQATGEAELDARTDVYAVGCVLFVMLAGEPPFTGPTSRNILVKQMSLPVPSVTVVRTTVPHALDRLLLRALAKAPADRLASAAEFDAGLEAVQRSMQDGVEAPPLPQGGRRPIVAGAAAVLLLSLGSMPGLLLGRSAPQTLGDTTSYVVVATRSGVPPNVVPDLPDLLREALGRWSGITVSDSVAARQRRGRSVTAALSRAGDSLRLRVLLRESNDSLLADQSERLSPNDPAMTTRLARVVDRVLFRESVPPNEHVPRPGRSLPSRQALAQGLAAVDKWRLAEADSLLQKASDLDPAYARAHLWLALARAWRDVEPARWRVAAQQAAAAVSSLTPYEARLAEIIAAQGNAEFPRACAGWRRLTMAHSSDPIAWFGSAHCQLTDGLVVADRHSPSGFSFRSSYNAALRDYRKAFQLRPAILASFSHAEIRRLFKTAGNLWREGRSASPDSLQFAADPEWHGDTLGYVPVPSRGGAYPRRVSPQRVAEAVRRLRAQVRDLASAWAAYAPRDASAREALALSLAELGDDSALDTIAVAERLAQDSVDHLRITVSKIWMTLAAAVVDGRPDRLKPVALQIDSLLRANPLPRGDAVLLSALAALTGRGHLAATYAGLPQLDRAFSVPAALRSSASPLLLYTALGGPADSVASLEQRTTAAIETTLRPKARPFARLGILARAATMAYPAHRMRAISTLAGQGDWLLDLQAALDRGDSAFVRDSLERVRRQTRSHLAPETITLDALLPEGHLLLALGDAHAAAAWLDPTLRSFGQVIPRLHSAPLEAAAVGRLFALRAQIAEALGERTEAHRWAQFARALWCKADRDLISIVD